MSNGAVLRNLLGCDEIHGEVWSDEPQLDTLFALQENLEKIEPTRESPFNEGTWK